MSENVEVVRRFYEAVKQQDFDSFVALHHPEAAVVPLILDIEGGRYRGREGVRQFWEDIHAVFPDWHWEPKRIQAIDQGALVHLRIVGHAEGTEVAIDQQAWHVLKLREGQVVWWRVFRSEREALEAAGLSE